MRIVSEALREASVKPKWYGHWMRALHVDLPSKPTVAKRPFISRSLMILTVNDNGSPEQRCQIEGRPRSYSANEHRLKGGLGHVDPGQSPLHRPKMRERDSGEDDRIGQSPMQLSGIKPPTTYEIAMVRALTGARFGSGRSRPSSKRIMKSTHRFGSAAMAPVTCASAGPSSP